ncbi:MAG: type transport system ATP-binding protein, partial [Myxococcales bacterium]|nr:type transport system ATP-binding protein [Myxococcales bacterium]
MMIALEGLQARSSGDRKRPASRLENVTLSWEKGVLVILGTPADGTTALLEVLAGILPVRGGRAKIDGLAPDHARARVAYVPLEAALPDALRVEEVCDLAGQIRGEPAMTVASRLAPLGIEKLANRRVRSLSHGEARAVSLAIALTSRAPVLLVDEPLSGLDPAAPARAIAALRARAADGGTVLVTSASVRDATALADQLGMLTRGVFTHLPPALAHVGTTGARLRVVVAAQAASEVAPFVAALAAEAAITSVETATFAATRVLHAAVSVVVTGADLLTVAR